VRNLGSLYLATGVLLLLYTAWLFWDVASGAYAAGLRQVLSDMDPNLRGPAERMMGFLLAAPVLLVLHAVPLGLAGLCLWSGIGLRSLRGRTAALVTAVLLAVLCLCTNCCCLLTLPVGIYAIFELTRMDTEAAMARAARAFRP
jgi:hypothetical protein